MNPALLDPWTISSQDLLNPATQDDLLRTAVALATLAPSGHNTQPWSFQITDDAVDVCPDRSRALPVADPMDRELTIACGAAVFYLRLALRNAGMIPEVTVLPKGAEGDVVARVGIGARALPTEEEVMLFAAISRRRTNRHPFEDRPLPPYMLGHMQAAAQAEGAWVVSAEGSTRGTIATLVEEGDRIQWADRQFRRELADWIRPRARGDGLSQQYMWGIGPLMVRRLNLGSRISQIDRTLTESAPLLVVVGTDGDEVRHWLAAGQALAHILLLARLDGVDASYLNQPIQVAALRPRLARAISSEGYPQVVLRLGYGPVVEPAPRRAAHEVMRI